VTASGALEPASGPDDTVRAVVATLLDLDGSYLAVQGPPGTGKTYVAAHTIRALVAEHGWRVGVVAQSHRVVENVLDGIVEAGLPSELVGKAPSSEHGPGYYSESPFTEIRSNGHLDFADRNAGRGRNTGGYVIGGTAWDFTNLKRVARRQLDLLVVDEAGQFSLAATIAVAESARRLLLLGDPQQLPQVSQGVHPAPVDGAALTHIGAGHDVLPAEYGYFLAQTRRMHPALADVISHLSYDGELGAHEGTEKRMLASVEPGLHPIAVTHHGNATDSPEEASAVLATVERLLGTPWHDPERTATPRPLVADDLIVVTPYNAQLDRVRAVLDAAGHHRVRVGTVDKFQGQQAVVSIVTLAASSADEVPRGLSFLLSRNRLNVAISRAQWASYLVYSPALLTSLPLTAEGVVELSRFIRLVTAVEPRRPQE
jgi:superfamily I DNA and/or RNA helicase